MPPERYGGFCRQSKPHGLSAFCFQCDLYVSGMERPSAYAATKSRESEWSRSLPERLPTPLALETGVPILPGVGSL